MLFIGDLINIDGTRFEYCDHGVQLSGGGIDSRLCTEGFIYFALKGSRVDGHDFIGKAIGNGAALAVVEEGYHNKENYPVMYCADVEKYMGILARKWRNGLNAKILAITGTNGKTSTKEMLFAILSKKYKTVKTAGNYNNQQGVPLTIFNISDETEIAIVEMGTNHFGEIGNLCEIADPDLGMITNIGAGHLESFGNKFGVLKAKLEMYHYLHSKNRLFFLNKDDQLLASAIVDKSYIKTFGLAAVNDFHIENVGVNKDGFGRFDYQNIEIELGIKGMMHCRNALAASAFAESLGINAETIAEALNGFSVDLKRGESVKYGVSEVIVDCYNANPSSMMEAVKDLSSLDEGCFFVLADMLELGSSSESEHRELGRFLNKISFVKLFLFGEEMEFCYQEMDDNDDRICYYNDFKLMKKDFDAIAADYLRIMLKGSRSMKLERLLDK